MKTRKKLVSVIATSCVALCLCLALLAGSTFAWFTDTLVSSGNIIKAGNIDIAGTVYYESVDGDGTGSGISVSTGDETIYPIISENDFTDYSSYTDEEEGANKKDKINSTKYYGYGSMSLSFDMDSYADLADPASIAGDENGLFVEPGAAYARLIKLENKGSIDAYAKYRFYAEGALGKYMWFDLIPVDVSVEDDVASYSAASDYKFTPRDIDTFNGTTAEEDEKTQDTSNEFSLKAAGDEVWMVLLFGVTADAKNDAAGTSIDLTMTIIATQSIGHGDDTSSGVVADYPIWGGENDLSWIPSGGPIEGETYTIYTPQQLGGLAYYCNTNTWAFKNSTVVMGADMDLGGYEWTPIGLVEYAEDAEPSSYYGFCGDFEGDGHTIYNLLIADEHDYAESHYDSESQMWEHTGLFGYVFNARIDGVTIHNANVSGRQNVGALIGMSMYADPSHYTSEESYEESDGNKHLLISDCHVEGMVKISGDHGVGGLIGQAFGTHIEGCSVEGVSGSYVESKYVDEDDHDGDSAGGIVGFMGTSEASTFYNAVNGGSTPSDNEKEAAKKNIVPVVNCHVEGLGISGTRKVGGVVGYAQCMIDMSGCEVAGCDLKIIYNEYASLEDNSLRTQRLFIGAFVGEYDMTVNVSGKCTTNNVSVTYIEKEAAGCVTGDKNYSGTTKEVYTDGLFGGCKSKFSSYAGITETTSGTLNATDCAVALIELKY